MLKTRLILKAVLKSELTSTLLRFTLSMAGSLLEYIPKKGDSVSFSSL